MIPENEEALLKEAFRIKNLDSFNVIDEILSYYACPEQCKGTCCKGLDIPLEESDIERISKANPKNKIVLENLVQLDETFTYWGYSVKASKTFPEKPCPFLNGKTSLCRIQEAKPISCKMYPFLTTPRDDLENPIKYEIVLCMMGLDIFIDYFLHRTNVFKDYIPLKEIEDFVELLLTYMFIDKTKCENLKSMIFPDIEALHAFLFYLTIDDAVQRVYYRHEFKLNFQKGLKKW